MVQVRKLVLAIAAASALTSGTAHALGLGGNRPSAVLAEPAAGSGRSSCSRCVTWLRARRVIPTSASPEEFNKAGVDRQYFLTDLKFTPVVGAKRPRREIRIACHQAGARESPYVNFLVEVLWPKWPSVVKWLLL